METKSVTKIVHVDKCLGGLILTFNDGTCAVYSEELLLEVFPRAKECKDAPEE